MHQTIEIRRRHDGSIDIGHYARIGRELHGNAVRNAVSSFVRLIGNGFGFIGCRRMTLPGNTRPERVFNAAE